MTIDQEIFIKKIKEMADNHYRENGDIYIADANMGRLLKCIEACSELPSILITPYLINLSDGALYELHYYEMEFEVIDTPRSYFVEHNGDNKLPPEIAYNLKPKAVIAKNDKEFFLNSLNHYLRKMSDMTFEEERKTNKRLIETKLFYQVF
jgi:hypothetical protein